MITFAGINQQTMKKILLLLAASLLLFAGCKKEGPEQVSDEGDPDIPILSIPPVGALQGKFTVNDKGKQVYFSKGNLYFDGSKFKFEANQNDISSTWNPEHVSHFFWNTAANMSKSYEVNYTAENSRSRSDIFFTNKETTTANPDFTVNVGEIEQEGWRTLSTEEWDYLFSKHSNKWVTVNGVVGYVIAPDSFTGTLQEKYENDAELANAGNLVFLPAAGRREVSNVYPVGNDGHNGYYWSSSAAYDSRAWSVYFYSKYVSLIYHDFRYYGFSVRLIKECQ